jgi:hypothetical protein
MVIAFILPQNRRSHRPAIAASQADSWATNGVIAKVVHSGEALFFGHDAAGEAMHARIGVQPADKQRGRRARGYGGTKGIGKTKGGTGAIIII